MISKLIERPSTWNLKLSVCDSGIRERVNIERFSDGHSGIAIVQSIVKKLGGYVTFSRETGTVISLQFFNSGHQEY